MTNFLAWFSPTRWAVLFGVLALGGALSAAAWAWHGWQVDGARDAAFSAGRLEAENTALREQQLEIARLIDVTNHLNGAYREQIQTIADAESRSAADAERVRKLRSQRAAAIASATPEAVRGYATAAGDVYAACREEYRALGFDAERCGAAAHTLDTWAKTLTREQIDTTRATLRTQPEKNP